MFIRTLNGCSDDFCGSKPAGSILDNSHSIMAETSNSVRRILERIRDDAQQALTVLGDSEEQRSLAWKCDGCGHVKHFTRPVPAEVAARCPKCGGESFCAC